MVVSLVVTFLPSRLPFLLPRNKASLTPLNLPPFPFPFLFTDGTSGPNQGNPVPGPNQLSGFSLFLSLFSPSASTLTFPLLRRIVSSRGARREHEEASYQAGKWRGYRTFRLIRSCFVSSRFTTRPVRDFPFLFAWLFLLSSSCLSTSATFLSSSFASSCPLT